MNAGEEPCDRVVRQMVEEQRKLLEAGALASAVIVAFSLIDAMAWVTLPLGRSHVRRIDFATWVERWMRSPGEPLEYDYIGDDLYIYRCGILHTFSSQGQTIAFHDGSHHRSRPDLHPGMVVLSITRLYDDLWRGIAKCLAAARTNGEIDLINSRFAEMFAVLPFGG